MDGPQSLFTDIFNRCLNDFFENDKRNEALGELFDLLHGPHDLPSPRECGQHRIRIKQLLPKSNTIVYYWNYGRVWQFFGIIENENEEQLTRLTKWLTSK